ncbi:MAG TPA: hypothetical protein VGI80_01855 [Pyrinomonadaceae bacterium]
MKRRLVQFAAILFVLAAAFATWVAIDLNRPYKVDIREFDADKVATLDTAMWRSYYSRDRVKLFTQLSDLLESEFQFPLWRRQRVALYAAKAAFVFKDGKTRGDYEKALPDIKNFYAEIHDVSAGDFNVEEAARLELEWWIVHRERAQHAPGDLSKALAAGAAVVYGVPAEKLKEYGDLRAEAMDIRDNTQAAGGVSEQDWQHIDDLLHRSWASLYNAVHK